MLTNDYSKIPRGRRSLFYRYGPIVFEPLFDSALEIFLENDSIAGTQGYEEGAWASEISVIRRLLEEIREREVSPYDGDRLLFQEAYEQLIKERKRPPTQKELFRRRWELGVMPNVKKHRSEWTGNRMTKELDAIYAGSSDDKKIPPPPRDSKSNREKTQDMGLVLLDGHKLRRYEGLYLKLTDESNNGKPPSLPEFVKRASELFPPENVAARELSFPNFLEVFASPFSWIPQQRWSQGMGLFQEVIDQALKSSTISKEQHLQVSSLYKLIIGFGKELENFIEGALPRSMNGEEARWNLERKRIFSRTVARLGRIPNFCEMWLENPEWVKYIDNSGGEIDTQTFLFRRMSVCYQLLSDGSRTSTVDQMAAEIPEIGTLADLVQPEVIFRELMIYFCSVDMERS